MNVSSSAKLAVRFFTVVVIMSGLLLVVLGVHDYYAESAVKSLKDRYSQIEKFRQDIAHYDEILTMSARMAAATGDAKWEKRYQEFEPKLNRAIHQAIALSPEIYREETNRSNMAKFQLLETEHRAFELIRQGQGAKAMALLFGISYEQQKNIYTKAIDRLGDFLKKQMEAALDVEKSKEHFARIAFITVLILMLLSWLMVLRITRSSQEALRESHVQLSRRTFELDELTRTLDSKVKERTQSLSFALTELQKTHKELSQVQTQLLRAEKFSAIGHLAAGIAHEINNPVGFIHSNLQTLERYALHYSQLLGILNKMEKALKESDGTRVAQIISSWEKIRTETNFTFIDGDVGNLIRESQEGTDRIRKIVSDLCTFASPDKSLVECVNLEALMESVLNVVWNELKYKAELKKEYLPVPSALCNPQKVAQVFVHLLMNAVQAIPEKGTIGIKIYSNDELVCIDISDTGCGIPPESVSNIFDPFFTTKPAGSGMGLGLSTSFDIVQKHGGALTFKTKVDEGTTFTVSLPAVDVQNPAIQLGGGI